MKDAFEEKDEGFIIKAGLLFIINLVLSFYIINFFWESIILPISGVELTMRKTLVIVVTLSYLSNGFKSLKDRIAENSQTEILMGGTHSMVFKLITVTILFFLTLA